MLNIGILGASWIAQQAIIEPAKQVDLANVVALACRHGERGERYANEHGIEHLFHDYAEMIASPEVDVVYVGLPPSVHAYWTEQALVAGKHVICEKPFAMNLAEAERMLKTAASTQARVVEAFHTVYHPSFAACKAWISSGAIGEVKTLEAHFGVPLEDDGKRNQFRPEAGGGSVMDMGCYPLQWVDACAGGEVIDIDAEAVMTPSGVDGKMAATLRFDNGAVAKIACSMVGPSGFSAGLTITGTKGLIEFDNPLVPHDGGKLTLKTEDGRKESHSISPRSTYEHQLEAVLSAFRSGEPLPTEGAPVLRQQKLVDDVYSAAGLEHLRTDYVMEQAK